MANFNNQFATQKLREEATEPETWPDRVPGNNGIIWKKEKEGSRGANYVPYYKGHNIDTGGYNFGNVQQLQKFIDDYILSNQLYNKLKFEPEKPLDEESVTGTGAGMDPSTVNNPVNQDWYTTKNKVKKEGKNIPSDWTDAKSIPNRPTKGGFIYKQLFEELSNFVKENSLNETVTDDKLSELDINDPILMAMRAKKDAPKPQASKTNPNQAKINMLIKKRAEIERDMEQEAEPEGGEIADKYGYVLNKIDQKIATLKKQGGWGPETDPYMSQGEIERRARMIRESSDKIHIGTDTKTDSDIYFHPSTGTFSINVIDAAGNRTNKLQVNTIDDVLAKFPNWKWTSKGKAEFSDTLNEGYTQFKNETKTRSKPDQFHQAIREVKKKVQQINKMYEYVSRLKTELSEGEDGLKYKMHTEKALNKIKEMVSELNYKIKRFK
jgi:hypothetical protein